MADSGTGAVAALLCACALLLCGCATLPDAADQRALYIDVRHIVETEERLGWLTDPAEFEEANPQILQSVCQVPEETRIDLLDWLDGRIEEEGGPAEEAYEREGKSLSAIEELLTLERMRGALEYSDERAADQCPFWLEPDPDFDGVQVDTHRFVLLGESMGGVLLSIQSENVSVGGGGGLRLFPAYGFNDRLTVGLGIEAGGSGGVSGIGQDQQDFTARAVGGIPLLFRIHEETWVYDLEATALFPYANEELQLPPGVRGLFALGISSVRISGFMPIGSGFVAYEYYPAFQDVPVTHVIRLGTRIGLDYDP